MSADTTDRDDDELLRPALEGVERPRPGLGRAPWRLQSQLYVGFFTGALPTTVIAWMNAERLGLPRRERLLIAGVGALGLVASVVAVLIWRPDTGTQLRFVFHSTGIATAAAQGLFQKAADRRYAFRHGDEGYDSLWVPGLAIGLTLGTLQNVALYFLANS